MPGNCFAMVEGWPDLCWRSLPVHSASVFWHYLVVLATIAAVPTVIATAGGSALLRARQRQALAERARNSGPCDQTNLGKVSAGREASEKTVFSEALSSSASQNEGQGALHAPLDNSGNTDGSASLYPSYEPESRADHTDRQPGKSAPARQRLNFIGALVSMTALLLAAAWTSIDRWTIFASRETDLECLVGTWVARSSSNDVHLGDITIRMTRQSGTVYSFRPDGTGSMDFGAGVVESGEHNGHLVTITRTGTIKYRYQVDDGVIHQDITESNSTRTLKIDDTKVSEKPLALPARTSAATEFSCSADLLKVGEGAATDELERRSRH